MESGFTLKKSFISEESVEEIKRKKQEEWEKAYENAEIKPPVEEYDARPLYQRLAEQRIIKEEAILEAAKFSNLIHRIDDDEFDFLKTLDDEERKKKIDLLKQERDELEKYRKAVKEASQSTVAEPNTTIVSKVNLDSKPRKRDLQRDILQSAIKKRRDSGGESQSSSKKQMTRSDTTTVSLPKTTKSNPSSEQITTTNPLLGLVDYSDEESE
ncbi:hypothetical protein K7432_003377 [Basidiobolus ranarum]|uniref:FAM192A/Fyv6 N-terminal domain-containing protein n=1 Tax=Basidiobolus ranarum TaxID=34480 RepID=A0ABR2W6N5_9FUNG